MKKDKEYLAIVATYTMHPDDAKAFRDIATISVEKTINKDGCIYYYIGEDVRQPGVFHLSEGWRDRAAYDKHAASADHTKTIENALTLRITGREAYTSIAQGRVPLT